MINEPDEISQRLDALALGFDEALPLTIHAKELVGRISLIVGASRTSPLDSRPAAVGPGIELDPLAHRVTKDGAEVHLRPKEFALLAVLAGGPGRAFTRDELVRLVWDPGYRGGIRTVDVHVRWIRAKLEADPARPEHLVTVRGTGYRLDTGPNPHPR